jgi:predicted enzyme related to lactoylglutathione lyase
MVAVIYRGCKMKYCKMLLTMGAAVLLCVTGAQAQQASKQQMAPPPVKQLGMMAAAVPVSDVDRAVAFYTTGVGMTLAGSGSPPGETPLNFPGGGVYLILMKSRGDAPLAPRGAASRVILAVPDLKALDARLTAAGFHLNGKINEMPQYKVAVAMVQDPDGNFIELVQRTE